MDVNHDGKVTSGDFSQIAQDVFNKLDRNHDGVLDKADIKGEPKSQATISSIVKDPK